jgi:hypothetical protein
MPFNNFIDEGKGVKSSPEEEVDISMKTKDARTLRENVFNFEFLLHNLNHIICGSSRKDGFLRIMSQAIANNAIMATTNHTLSPL